MAQYGDSIGGFANGVGVPVGYTQRWEGLGVVYTTSDDVDAPNGKKLNITHTGSTAYRNFISRDEVNSDPDRGDSQQLILIRQASSASNQTYPGMLARGAGSSPNNETGRAGTLSNVSGARRLRMNSYNSGTGTVVNDTTESTIWEYNTLYWLLLTVRGSSATLGIYALSDPECLTPLREMTVSPLAANGTDWLGLFSFSIAGNADILWHSLGTGTDDAPRYSPVEAISFSGAVPTQNLVVDVAMTPLDLSIYFDGTETPFAYTVQSGTLPAGLSLNSSTGVISGTPTAVGSASINIRATDDASNTADTNNFNIVVEVVTPVTFSGTVPTLTGEVGTSFSESLASYFSGTETPFVYSLQSGTLPAWASLNSSTGVISGTPDADAVTSGLVVRATDDASNTDDTNSFSIDIDPTPAPTYVLRNDQAFEFPAETLVSDAGVTVTVLTLASPPVVVDEYEADIVNGYIHITDTPFDTEDDTFKMVVEKGTYSRTALATVVAE